MTKWPAQKQTLRTAQKYVEHQDARHSEKKLFWGFSDLSFLYFLV